MYPIPANAMRIRYLESTGTQYVDTGVAVSDPSTIAIEADEDVTQPLGFTHQMVVSGTWVSRYSPPEATGNLYIYYKDFNKRVVTSANETRKTARWCGSSGYYENGASLTSFVASVGSDSIAGRNWLYGVVWDFDANSVDFRFSRAGKIYGLKVEVSGQLVRSFVPVRVGRVGYLFDRVSGQFFGNAGTGSFVLGPDTFQQGVVPTRMMVGGVMRKKSITFIRATGTCYPTAEKTNNCSYINTAINPDAQTIVEIVCRVKPGSAIQAWPYLLGAQTANDNANTFSVRGQANNTSYAPWTNYRWGHSAWQSFGISETWGGSSTWHTINVSRSGIVLDGIQHTATGTTNTNLPNKPIFIGCINRNGSPQNCILLDVASLKIWNGTTLQFDGTPQVVNGVAGLKDSVSGSLFSSSSSSNPYQLLQEPAS